MSGARLDRVNELLKMEVGKVLLTDFEFDNAFVTVVRATTSPTLEHATVWVSVLPIGLADQVLNKIKNGIHIIQKHINSRMKMKIVPKVQFRIDDSEERASRIEKIIEEIKE